MQVPDFNFVEVYPFSHNNSVSKVCHNYFVFMCSYNMQIVFFSHNFHNDDKHYLVQHFRKQNNNFKQHYEVVYTKIY